MIQTILFERDKWDLSGVIEYLYKNGYTFKKLDITDNYYRARQNKPIKNGIYHSKKLNNGIILIYVNK